MSMTHVPKCAVRAGFDGDDCFSDFNIGAAGEGGTGRFGFGAFSVHGLRKVSRFFRDDSQKSVTSDSATLTSVTAIFFALTAIIALSSDSRVASFLNRVA
jgi:hypothetical protein